MFRKKKPTVPTRADYLIVGLGNPGKRYEATRHNAGFLAVDLLCKQLDVRCNHIRCKALTAAASLAGHSVVLAKPQTFMNLSGESVRDLAAALEVPAERVIVLFDDAALPAGRVRVRRGGSAGGHNGIKSIIGCLGTQDFPRVKLGIGGPDRTREDMVDFVLDALDSDTRAAIRQAPDIVACILRQGLDKAMQIYNTRGEAEEKQP